MVHLPRWVVHAMVAASALVVFGLPVATQEGSDPGDPASKPLPNPNGTVIKNWGELPAGRTWGSTAGVDIGPDGHIWAYDRCVAAHVRAREFEPTGSVVTVSA